MNILKNKTYTCRFTLLAALCSLTSCQKPLAADESDYLEVSGSLIPRVAYAVKRAEESFMLSVQVEGYQPQAADVSVSAGVQAGKTVLLASEEAEGDALTDPENRHRTIHFRVPASDLVETLDDWKKLRVAFDVEWAGGPAGEARLKQRFLHLPGGASHAGLASDPAEWQPLDLLEWEKQLDDRRQEIHFSFEQPVDGKATLVIEDAQGNRVRNLISGQFMEKGSHRIVWDGLNENEDLAVPGAYRWRSLSHPGLKPEYLMAFVDAPGSNHGTFHAATTIGNYVILATPVSEGGHQVVVLEKDGTFVRGFNAPHGIGLGRVQVAADDQYIYAAYDGNSWGRKIDRTKPDWKATMKTSLVRFEIATGNTAYFDSDNKHMPEMISYEVGPGSPGARPDERALRGLVLINGKLFLADTWNDEVKVVDVGSGKIERTFPLKDPLALAGDGKYLYALTADLSLVKINPSDGKSSPLAKLSGKPAGLTLDPEGRIYISDQDQEIIRVLDATGKEVSTIGHAGGVHPGPYDPLTFTNPEGLVVLDGLLWVTENERWTPKRFAAFDVKSGQMVHQFFGPTNYGAQGAGMDDQNEKYWIGQGTLFELDFEKKTSKPLAILGGEKGRRHTFYRQDGRTFIITSGKATYLQELKDGKLQPLALFSSAHQYAYSQKWKPSEAFLKAFQRDYPGVEVVYGKRGGIQRIKPGHGYGMLWVDRDGDSEMQSEEIEFATAADNLGGSAWSHDFQDLIMRVPGAIGDHNVLVTLKPEGWWPGGAPKYPALNDAVNAGMVIDLPGRNMIETAVDRFGNTIMNSGPMTAFSAEGKLLWTYPNQWNGVHGSHKAPLPTPGELQGALFFSGMVPLDEVSDVFLLNGNHGRAFVMTSDGLYIDEMFTDVRLMSNPQEGGIGILGGECFGGTFGYSKKTGDYYFQGGGISYKIYKVKGLKETHRQEGTLAVTVEQIQAVERIKTRQVAKQSVTKLAIVTRLAATPGIDGNHEDWKDVAELSWEKGKKFTVNVHAGYDMANLYLRYKVKDESPWVNQGKDWQSLFKTGDGVDFQLGTNAEASPKRGGPVPGDLRIFIAPSADGDVAVLYRHRVPGAKENDGVVFQSPWRSEKVDVVQKLQNAKITVHKQRNSYTVEVVVPLTALGGIDPSGLTLRGDFGVIYGDAGGTINIFRNYWSNQSTGLVNDVPGEIMLIPSLWGEINFEEIK